MTPLPMMALATKTAPTTSPTDAGPIDESHLAGAATSPPTHPMTGPPTQP